MNAAAVLRRVHHAVRAAALLLVEEVDRERVDRDVLHRVEHRVDEHQPREQPTMLAVRSGITIITPIVTAIMPCARMIHGRRRPKRRLGNASMTKPHTNLNEYGSVVIAITPPIARRRRARSRERYAGSVIAVNAPRDALRDVHHAEREQPQTRGVPRGSRRAPA